MSSFPLKALPDPDRSDIIPPDMDYSYFEKPGRLKPDFRNVAFSPVSAWWFAECSFLSYCHPGFAKMAWKLAGFDGFHFFQGKGTECMVSWNRKVLIASFRGTELKSRSALHEIATDLNALPVPFEQGGKVHKGFLDGLEEIWSGDEGLESFLKAKLAERMNRPLWITGHSLGGALATLCYARMPEAAGAYIYGAPRVGDNAFVSLFEGKPFWRLEHGGDPIPQLPPDLPSLGFNFREAGNLVYISKDDKLLNRRPVYNPEEQRRKRQLLLENQEARMTALAERWDEKGWGASKDVLGSFGRHLRRARREWLAHLDEAGDVLGLTADDHQPVFYAVRLWNHLAREAAH